MSKTTSYMNDNDNMNLLVGVFFLCFIRFQGAPSTVASQGAEMFVADVTLAPSSVRNKEHHLSN